jgi:phosphatidylinositol-3,4,5-trisphosphate 3-phosphatase/dual-specificity protein phosphatase PTEN
VGGFKVSDEETGSKPPSIRSSTTTDSEDSVYDAIDVGDEAAPGVAGQQDRGDGKVDEVFKLHSSRRMKPSSTKRGVSIPSRK